jgi:tetratricopeptide (TPR) repeat protein
MSPDPQPAWQEWIETFSREEDARIRRTRFREYAAQPDLAALADRLYAEVVNLTRVDLLRAARIAQALGWLAAASRDAYSKALSARAQGHMFALTGKYEAAIKEHSAAIAIFESLGRETDAGRALMNLLQPLIYLGRYSEAVDAADRARAIFAKQGDLLRLARLDSNVGNILYRQDRFADALALYQRAHGYLVEHGDHQDVAIVLRNMAVCFISLNRFEEALDTYHQARQFCEVNHLPLLVAECDYNIAYLHYLRGEYTRAIAMYQTTRVLCEELADRYHTALCDLDLSELYLELNLSEEGYELAQRAQAGFTELKMGYEAAKAVTFQAIAANQRGDAGLALAEFARARRLFVREKNDLWPALIRLYEALVLEEQGAFPRARRVVTRALKYFRTSPSVAKTALCHLLLARLDLKQEQLAEARQSCRQAVQLLDGAESPAADFQAQVVLGQIEELAGTPAQAYAAFERAHGLLETLRSRLLGEELKIAFLKDKLEVYESLVHLAQRQPAPNFESDQRAFHFIERAKSRSLADLINFNLNGLPPRIAGAENLGSQLEDLRLRLTLAHRQVQRAEMLTTTDARDRVLDFRRRSREYEGQIAGMAPQLRALDGDFATLVNAGTATLPEIQSALAANSVLLEYYVARGEIHACVMTRHSLRVFPLGSAARAREVFRLLQFQLSKFRLGPDYLVRFAPALQRAVNAHLGLLHKQLIAPIQDWLDGSHLVIVPHSFLHYLPFHALVGEGGALIDRFTISMAPSASVFALCAARPSSAARNSLVLGIPDPRAPQIRQEAQAVAAILPESHLFLGAEATEEVLRERAPRSRFVHIATHGLFRQDNPMFSSIRLGGSELNLYDIYRLRLDSDLVTLSGCGTGLNVVVGGDELLGLVRGLLYAGASAVLVTLWDVNDATTAMFMQSFYGALSAGASKAAALRTAMLAVRREHPHPYHWAPFVLIGKYD